MRGAFHRRRNGLPVEKVRIYADTAPPASVGGRWWLGHGFAILFRDVSERSRTQAASGLANGRGDGWRSCWSCLTAIWADQVFVGGHMDWDWGGGDEGWSVVQCQSRDDGVLA